MPLHCTMEKTSSDFPSDFPFLEYLLDLVSEKSTICNLDSDGTNSIPPSQNTEQLLQIDVKYVLILFTFLILHIHKLLTDRLDLMKVVTSLLKEETEENQNLDFVNVRHYLF